MDFHTSPPVSKNSFSFLDRMAHEKRDIILLLARIALSAIFVQGGFTKLMDVEGFLSYLDQQQVPFSKILGVVGIVIESFCGLAIVLGIWTRFASLLVIVFTVAATIIAHRYWELSDAMRMMQQIQFMKNLAIAGGFLALLVSGGGRLSLDRWVRKS